MVLLVLALAWGAVLFFWFRSRAQTSFSDSVGLFHRHLHVLERAAPGTLMAANRLRSPSAAMVPLGTLRPIRTAAPVRSRPVRHRPPVRTSGAQVVAVARRRQTQRRRRDVLFVLTILTVASFVVAVVTRGADAMMVQVVCDLALVGYAALLVRLRNLSAERELRPMARPVAAAAIVRRPRPSGRRALTPSYAVAAGYGSSGYDDSGYGSSGYVTPGYGEPTLRRAVGQY